MKILGFLVSGVLVPVLVSQFTDLLPWFAGRLVKAAARTLPSEVRSRYADEWLAELDAAPGSLVKLAVAIRIFVRAPATIVAITGAPAFKAQTVKALFDRAAALAALILLAPLFVVVMLAVKLGGHGPAFSRQVRVGKNGRAFSVWKFRTIVVDAARPKGSRATKVGSLLRRYSLDELPQLFNVLLGDMSLVGPRPVRPDEVPEQGDRMRHRLAAKPGLTGLWQVARLPYMPWYESERLQKRYVDNWSLVLDLQILWKMTAEVVQGRTRADITEAIHPHWRDVPQECEHGHPWEPDSVWVRWVLCECPSAIAGCTEGARGHLAVYCGRTGCRSVLYLPRHEPGTI
ncbi:MAG: sugar transferase [Streptosporangiaceae bacterium]